MTVAFEKLESLSLGHYGLFWSHIRDEFPVSESRPAVVQELETFTDFRPAQPQFQFLAEDALPRALFRNPDTGELVQIQPDRFSFNWIKTNDDHAYPHSEAVLERFLSLFAKFSRFASEQGLGEITPVQCELTNVNVVPVSDVGEAFPDVATVIRMPNLATDFSCIQLENQMVGAKHLIIGDSGAPLGRVHSLGQPTLQVNTGEPAYRLDIVARGAPSIPDLAGVEAFFDRAVSAVNAVFLASITKAGRQFWGEKDG